MCRNLLFSTFTRNIWYFIFLSHFAKILVRYFKKINWFSIKLQCRLCSLYFAWWKSFSEFVIYRNGIIIDSDSKVCSLYPEVEDILTTLLNQTTLTVASRIEDIASAYQMLQFYNISQYFPFKEIYPCSKSVHLRRYVNYHEII